MKDRNARERSFGGCGGRGVACLLLGLVANAAQAQEYAIPWFSVDAGGGSSGGGDYRLVATLGQVDANLQAQGGGYTLRSGFLAGFDRGRAVPELRIIPGGDRRVRLDWEDPQGEYVLQQAGRLEPGAWADMAASVVPPVSLNALEAEAYFRLRRR